MSLNSKFENEFESALMLCLEAYIWHAGLVGECWDQKVYKSFYMN
jgi:hypothetical protein